MKRIRTGNVVACEYVALGSNRKHTIINCYTGDILVAHYPAKIPLAFYIELYPEPDMSQLKFYVMQNKKKVAEIEAEIAYEAGRIGLVVIPQLPFKMAKETTLRVLASSEGFKTTTILSKKISLGPVPDAG